MNKFKFIKRGTVYTPVQVTTGTGAIIVLYANEEKLNTGDPTDIYTFEELNNLEGGIRVILDKEI